MAVSEWLVLLAGIAAIGWVNWYFFLAQRGAAQVAAGAGGTPEITVVVRGGYTPAAIRVEHGRPVRLVFDRQESAGCSEELVLPEFGIRKYLPPHQKTPIELTPQRPGTYEFTCGMGMLRGTLIVE